jgi:hypothetical protein
MAHPPRPAGDAGDRLNGPSLLRRYDDEITDVLFL